MACRTGWRTPARRAVTGRMSAVERGRLLSKLAVLVADHAEELALLEARDTGKPMKQARADMVATARYFEFYGGAADKAGAEHPSRVETHLEDLVVAVKLPVLDRGPAVRKAAEHQRLGTEYDLDLARGDTLVVFG